MSIFLNQSSIIFNVNISFSDFFCAIVLIILVIKKRLLLPIIPTIYFLVISASVLFTSAFIVPVKFFYNPDFEKIFVDYIKLLVIFAYFIIGYSLSNLKLNETIVKWYSKIALLIGVLGIFVMIFDIRSFHNILFLSRTRYRGLMNDPNYFSIIQISALVYFVRLEDMKKVYRFCSIFVITLSIILSGSKTGMITLIGYLALRMLQSLFSLKRKVIIIIFHISLIILIALLMLYTSNVINDLLKYLSNIIPAFKRIQSIFVDFDFAITGNGSGRKIAWETALKIINLSPIVGIGIGTYLGISKKIFGVNVIAHNTYLQLFSEWGLFLSIPLLLYIFITVAKATINKKTNRKINIVLRDIIIVFLIGSLAVSLNNARMFWLFLGMLVFNVRYLNKS